jgi:hypothetical protein
VLDRTGGQMRLWPGGPPQLLPPHASRPARTSTDPVTLAVVFGGVALVAAIASLVPAWRATQVDPEVVLRQV